MRPVYESQSDLDHEARLIELLCAAWGVSAHKINPHAYGLDHELLRLTETVAFAEAKKRIYQFGNGDGYRISLQKVMKADQLTASSKKPAFMVVGFTDGIARWADFSKRLDMVISVGRRDRNDPYDIEPHCVYAWNDFHEVKQQ